MTCPPCNRACNEGRTCPAKPRRKLTMKLTVLALVALLAIPAIAEAYTTMQCSTYGGVTRCTTFGGGGTSTTQCTTWGGVLRCSSW